MREAGPLPVPSHPWQFTQVPFLHIIDVHQVMMAWGTLLELIYRGEIKVLVSPVKRGGALGNKKSFTVLGSSTRGDGMGGGTT